MAREIISESNVPGGSDGEEVAEPVVEPVVEVESRSTRGLSHWVARGGRFCTCRGFRGHGHCYHRYHPLVGMCLHCDGRGHYISYPKLMNCLYCEGTGLAAWARAEAKAKAGDA